VTALLLLAVLWLIVLAAGAVADRRARRLRLDRARLLAAVDRHRDREGDGRG
jgi:hypothetical protein